MLAGCATVADFAMLPLHAAAPYWLSLRCNALRQLSAMVTWQCNALECARSSCDGSVKAGTLRNEHERAHDSLCRKQRTKSWMKAGRIFSGSEYARPGNLLMQGAELQQCMHTDQGHSLCRCRRSVRGPSRGWAAPLLFT